MTPYPQSSCPTTLAQHGPLLIRQVCPVPNTTIRRERGGEEAFGVAGHRMRGVAGCCKKMAWKLATLDGHRFPSFSALLRIDMPLPISVFIQHDATRIEKPTNKILGLLPGDPRFGAASHPLAPTQERRQVRSTYPSVHKIQMLMNIFQRGYEGNNFNTVATPNSLSNIISDRL